MTLQFPSSPSNNDVYENYIYNSTAGAWQKLPGNTFADAAVSDTPPVNPNDGDLWLNSADAKMYIYYNDGDSSQWIAAVGGTVPSQGKIIAVESVLKTDTFSASVTAGNNTAVTDLSITHALSNASNKLLITAFFGVASSSNETSRIGIAINDGSGFLALGDAAGTRTSVTAGGNYQTTTAGINSTSPSISILHSPGTTASKTYNVHIINTNSGTNTLYVNRTSDDSDAVNRVRGASSIIIQEVAA